MVFFHKIKDTFAPIFLLIWIFCVCHLSPTWYNIDCCQLMSRFDLYQLQLVYPTWSIVQREISSTKFHKPLLTYLISHSTFSIHCTNQSTGFVFTTIRLRVRRREGYADWSCAGGVWSGRNWRKMLGSSCGDICAKIYLGTVAAIFLEKSKLFLGEKQLPHPVGYHSSHPLELCMLHPTYLFCFVLSCFVWVFSFLLSFLPSCILNPCWGDSTYTDLG